jgi:ATP-independent RNA helicase DbpA
VPGRAPNVTLVIDGGKADKLRPGDVLGALIGETGLEAESIGKIDVGPKRTLVAVRSDCAGRAVASGRIKIKGRRFRIGALR